MEGRFPFKILVFVTAITHNCNSFFCLSQIFHILPNICEGFILSSQIRFFERAFWVCQKFLVANRHFSCSVGSMEGPMLEAHPLCESSEHYFDITNFGFDQIANRSHSFTTLAAGQYFNYSIAHLSH